jgi:hypothetical protein
MATLRMVFSVVGALCALAPVRADDLIWRNGLPPIRDVVAQFQFRDAVDYWSVEDGLLWKRTVSTDSYEIDFAPDKLGAIRSRWRARGSRCISK